MKKRSNVFMLSYITFIIFSIVLRCFMDYELWGPIVLAVTTSSILFAIEDFLGSTSNHFKNIYEIENKIVEGLKEKITNDLEMVSIIDNKANKYKDYSSEMDDFIEKCKISKSTLEKMLKNINEIVKDSKEKYKLQKKFFNIANIFAFIGFFTLFCVLIIASLFTVPTLIQEIITVSTFAIILLTQHINVIVNKRIKENSSKSDRLLIDYDEIRNLLQNLKIDFYKFMETINKHEQAC